MRNAYMLLRQLTRLISLVLIMCCVQSIAVADQISIQGRGYLAQAPMNVQSQTSPAFIFDIDDSNSMAFELLLSIGDNALIYNNCSYSFFGQYGEFLDQNYPYCIIFATDYLYLFGQPGYSQAYPGQAIPPINQYGFARSSDFNTTYYNPFVTYSPWRYPVPKNGKDRWPNADPKQARIDPRSPYDFSDNPEWFQKGYNQVYDLTSMRNNPNDRFNLDPQMILPDISGQDVYYRFPNQNYWNTRRYRNYSNGQIPLIFAYFPATFYLKDTTPVPQGYRNNESSRPLVQNACGYGCHLRRYQIKPENYWNYASYSTAIQNFANWFQYHRNRILSVVSSLSESLHDVNNMRVGYFTINKQDNVTMYKLPEQREALYQKFYRLQTGAITLGWGNGGTPNRTSVDFMARQFQRNDADAPIQLSCQKNAGLLFTDGYTNASSDTNPNSLYRQVYIGNVDGSLASPFADAYPNTIADITAKYYSGDGVPLRGENSFQRGAVPVPDQCKTLDPNSIDYKRLDCQTDLHMNFYAVTLGTYGRIYGVNQSATADPFKNPPDWNSLGDPTSQQDPSAVDELWHAAINSRGNYVSATSTLQVASILSQVLSTVGSGAVPSGSLSLTGSRIGKGSLAVTPFYAVANNGTDWYGKLTAQTPLQVDNTVSYKTTWEASALLPAASARSLFIGTDAGAAVFDSRAVTLARLCSDTADGLSRCSENDIRRLGISLDQAIAYLRGDQTLENSSSTPLRQRTNVLGDIINSSPVIAAPTDDYGYRSIYVAKENRWDPFNYGNYLLNVKSKKPSVVYVGANDGIMHAFEASSGREMFGYIPQSVVGHLGNLLFPYTVADGGHQKFQHRYFVDGQSIVSDAYINGQWKTILVGTTGAGGRGVYALDVTDPLSFSEKNLLWEFNSKSNDDLIANLSGYVLGKPVIVPIKSVNGNVRWVAIWGNGYNSTYGVATLFVVDLNSGGVTLLPALEDSVGYYSNGIGNLVAVDRWGGDALTSLHSDGYADTVYAADQNGAIWRFDLRFLPAQTSYVQTQPELTRPFFTATDATGRRQAITGGLEIAAGPSNGVMLYFGTGSFSFLDDLSDKKQQSFYAVLDPTASALGLTRRVLQQQTVTSTNDGTRSVSAQTVSANNQGWFVDLIGAGERIVGSPRLANGTIFFTSYQPSSAAECGAAGANWLYGLNALTGAGSLSTVNVGSNTQGNMTDQTGGIALTGGGSAPIRDVGVFSTPRIDVVNPKNPGAQNQQCSLVITTPGAQNMFIDRACGRQSWRQIK